MSPTPSDMTAFKVDGFGDFAKMRRMVSGIRNRAELLRADPSSRADG